MSGHQVQAKPELIIDLYEQYNKNKELFLVDLKQICKNKAASFIKELKYFLISVNEKLTDENKKMKNKHNKDKKKKKLFRIKNETITLPKIEKLNMPERDIERLITEEINANDISERIKKEQEDFIKRNKKEEEEILGIIKAKK